MRDTAPTDHDLATSVKLGDSQALNTLVVRYYQPLLNFVVRYVHSLDVAEDVLQDVFIRLWERRATWEIPDSVRAYLYTMSRHAALDLIRRASARERYESTSADESDPVAPSTPSEALEQEEFAEAVRHAVAELPDRGREIYVLAHQHGLSYREIADTLGISVPTVKTHMGRSIVALERRLRRFLAVF